MARMSFKHEIHYAGIVAGIDEAGRGPWAGPVVAAAVILNKKQLPAGINDSKKLNKVKRVALYHLLLKNAIVGVGICTVEEIDQHNILGATKHAMRRAFDALPHKPDIALVDGNRLPELPCRAEAIIGGDALCISIAAASIIAKVTRDNIMVELAKEFPQYGFDSHVGYGTKAHQENLALFGACPHHRKSFAPIRKLLEAGKMQVA